jgi:hypothetical protein
MHTTIKSAAVLGLLISAPLVQADSFTGFSIDFVDIGNPGNPADNTGHGAVGYNYRIGVHEVSRAMIEAYNTNSGGPTLTLHDMTSYGGNGVNRPATGLSWNEAARFVNWLNTSTGHAAAYKFTTDGANDNISLWQSGDAGFDASNPYRNRNAHYVLPSEDEWYKAAYYSGSTSTYYNYATGSDTPPTEVASGTTSGTAVYNQLSATGPADITNAGGLSPYGTMAQNGNVVELTESGHTTPNDLASDYRVGRGGYWRGSSDNLPSGFGVWIPPNLEAYTWGFRVASVLPYDSDENGLADAWEQEHFETIGVDPDADADGDSNSNLMEFLAGTDPKDIGSHFKPEGIHKGTSHAIPIQTMADRKYEVFASRDLVNWHLQETYTGDGTQKTFSFDETTITEGPLYSATHPSTYFFRVKITGL